MNAITTPGTDTSPTPIRMMHARYEAAWREYSAIEEAHMIADKRGDDGDETQRSLALRLMDGLRASNYESDTLRQAILYQVPHDSTDALILQYHIWSTADLVLNATIGEGVPERRALEAALDAVFDFYASESSEDHEALGTDFKRGTMLAWERRRLRTGLVEAWDMATTVETPVFHGTNYLFEMMWREVKEVTAAINALPDNKAEEAEGVALWNKMGSAEMTILKTRAMTPRGAEIQLWVTVLHAADNAEMEAAVIAEDCDYLAANFTDFDMIPKGIVAAILSLRAVAGL